MSGAKWTEAYRILSPFGNNNPRPLLRLDAVTIKKSATALTRKADGVVWAYKTEGSCSGVTYPLMTTDETLAKTLFVPGTTCNLLVDFSWSDYGDRTFYNIDIKAGTVC